MTTRSSVAAAVLAIAVFLVAAYAWYTRSSGQVVIPSVSTAAMEPQVARLIEETRQRVAERRDSADAWGRLAQVYHAHDLYAAAVASYDEAIELAPESFRWRYLAAHAMSRIDPGQAVGRFRAALALDPTRDEAWLALADLLTELGRLDEAREALVNISDADDYAALAHLGLGRLALLGNQPAEARAQLESARTLAPRNGEVHAALAQIYLRAGETGLAVRATELAKTFAEPLRPQDFFLSTMESLAANSRAVTQRGIRLAERGDYAAAEEQFRRVLEIRPGTAIDHSNLASALLRQGNHGEALQGFKTAMSLDSGNAEVLSNYGLTLLQMGKPEQGMRLLSRAVEADPGYAQAHLNLGVLYENQGKLLEAEASYQRALDIDGSLAEGWLNLGSLRARREDFDAAIDAWERLRLLQPSDPAAVYNLGLAHRKLGQHQRAASLFSEGLASAPNSSRFVAELAWEQATAPDSDARDGTAALMLAERLVAARPNEPRFADIKAAALAEKGDFTAAQALAEKAAALAPPGSKLAREITERLALYEAGEPYRQPAPAAAVD